MGKIQFMPTLEQLKREFLEYTEIEKGRSLHTVRNYDHYLSVFLKYSKVKISKDITDTLIREYRLWLNRQPHSAPTSLKLRGASKATRGESVGNTLKKKTQNYYLIALRAFLKYLAKRGFKTLSPEAIELAKVGERPIDLITPEELTRLLEAPDTSTPAGLRDKAILEVLFSTGLRVSELCSLPRDLDLASDEFSVRGKGEKVRVVFLSPEAKSAIKNYLEKRKDIDDDRMFPTTARSIERIVKHSAIKAGISVKVTPHVIRHCFATDLLSNGADLRSVQMLLGHANIATTQIYTHVTDKALRDTHKRFHSRRK